MYIPMLIWSIPYLLLSIYNGMNIVQSIILFLVGGFTVYYFVALIVQYYFLLPYLQKLAYNRKGLIISALISGTCMIILSLLSIVLNLSIPLILYAGTFPVWIVFFVLGLYIGNSGIKISSKKLLVITIVGLIISIVETYLHIYISGTFSGLGIKVGAFVYSFAMIMFLFSLNNSYISNSIIWRFLVYLGRINYGVYLIHMFILGYIVSPMAGEFKITNYFSNQLFLVVLTVLLCVGFITITRRINKSIAAKFLGF